MSGSLNKVMIIGNLCADPDIRHTANGNRVASLRIATNENWRDRGTGERKTKAEYHSVVIFNDNLVKVVEQYVKNGSKIYIEGQLQTRKWQDQNGNDRYTTEVVLQKYRGELQMLDSKGSADNTEQRHQQSSNIGQQYAAQKGNYNAPLDDDVPF